MVSQNKDAKQRGDRDDWRALLVTIFILLGLFILFELLPFVGNVGFYSKWIECGQKPVVIQGSGFLNAGVSSYSTPPSLQLFPGERTYFCTAFDAEKHGYSANSETYEFPVLRRANAICQKPTDPKPETAVQFPKC